MLDKMARQQCLLDTTSGSRSSTPWTPWINLLDLAITCGVQTWRLRYGATSTVTGSLGSTPAQPIDLGLADWNLSILGLPDVIR